MALTIGGLQVSEKTDEKLPGAIRDTSTDHLQFVDPIKTKRVFRFVVKAEDANKAVSAVRRAAEVSGLGVRVIKSDPDGNGRVQVSAQGKDRRAYKERKPITEAQKAERAARRAAKKAAKEREAAKSKAPAKA